MFDPRQILSRAQFYDLHARIVGSEERKKRFVTEILRPRKGERVLDIGCGTADLLAYMNDVDYVGFDANLDYIETARARYSDRRAEFHHRYLTRDAAEGMPKFGLVMAIGVLHHLDDAGAETLFRVAREVMDEGGRIVTCDGVFEQGQNPIARFLISLDRGEHVRRKHEYESLANKVFANAHVQVRHDLSRIPYTHCIIEAVQ